MLVVIRHFLRIPFSCFYHHVMIYSIYVLEGIMVVNIVCVICQIVVSAVKNMSLTECVCLPQNLVSFPCCSLISNRPIHVDTQLGLTRFSI